MGDWVLLRLHHHTAVGITPASSSKLGPHYFGPYQVIERIGAVACRLRLPPKARIHDVFHVALLKKFEGAPPAELVPLPPILYGRVVPTPFPGGSCTPELWPLGITCAVGGPCCS